LKFVIAQYQLCQGWPTPVWVKHGQAIVYRPAFWWDSNGLTSATLDAPISVFDIELATGDCIPGTDRSVLVDVTWTGVGETTQWSGPAATNIGLPYVAVFGSAGAARSAEVSGSVIDGATDYAAGVAGSGLLTRNATLTVSLDRWTTAFRLTPRTVLNSTSGRTCSCGAYPGATHEHRTLREAGVFEFRRAHSRSESGRLRRPTPAKSASAADVSE
jgi:hypothetical protein